MKALVFEQKVVQIEADEFPVHPNLVWIDITGVTPTPQIGWSHDGETFTAPPPPPPPPDAVDTPLTAEDTERLLLGITGVTRGKIDQAKRDRGKPLP